MPTGERLASYKLLFPQVWEEYGAQRETFTKEWNAMLGL